MKNLETIIQSQRTYFNTQATKSIDFRIAMLKTLKQKIKALEQEIFDALEQDLHKSQFESYVAEVALVVTEINIHIKNLKLWSKPKAVPTPLMLLPSCSRVQPEPYGIVLIISPWNYPFQLTILPLVGAIAAGNCALLKTSPFAPATTRVIEKLITQTFTPEYVHCIEDSIDLEKLLSQKTDYIFFTGSSQSGKMVMRMAAEHLIPVTLELGGKSPCIVDEDADIKIAAKRIAYGKFSNAGQICVSPDYIVAHHNIKDKLITQLKVEIQKLYQTFPMQSLDYCRIIHEKHFARLVHFIKENSILFGGEYDESQKYIAPTLIDNPDKNSRLMQEEIFGPLLPVITFHHIQEVIRDLQQQEKPLALYYFSNNKKKIQQIVNETSSGGVCINDTLLHVANHYLPFGGVGNSGMGKYHGKYSFETFSHLKAIMQSPTWIDIPFKYPPYKNKLQWIKKLF